MFIGILRPFIKDVLNVFNRKACRARNGRRKDEGLSDLRTLSSRFGSSAVEPLQWYASFQPSPELYILYATRIYKLIPMVPQILS